MTAICKQNSSSSEKRSSYFSGAFFEFIKKTLFLSLSRLASSSHNRVVVAASIEKKTGRKSNYLYALTPSFAYAFGHTHARIDIEFLDIYIFTVVVMPLLDSLIRP